MGIQNVQAQGVMFDEGIASARLPVQSGKAGGVSYLEVLQSVQGPAQSLEEMWKSSFEKYFHQSSSQYFYHVMDAPSISANTWQHNDFPRDELMRENIDSSVFSWQPSRGNPSQLDARVQARAQATLGKNSIIVPSELEERMRQDPALAKKVMANIDRVYEFHRPMPQMTLPGTKFYGTKVYGSVIILNKDGEVENSCVTSGGGMLGPDERTLRQIEEEQAKKQRRKDENRRLVQEAAIDYYNNRLDTLRYSQSPLFLQVPCRLPSFVLL